MSRISAVFKDRKRKALIAYITVGYPDISSTPQAAMLLAKAGCDLIELGIPFSDPLADGATIQASSHRALLNGVTVSTCLETAAKIRAQIDKPLVFMTYLNPVLKYGIDGFCSACSAAGVDGLIVPDLPPGELPEFDKATLKHGIDTIYLLAPNSSQARIKQAAKLSRGFIYLVSVTGVTGVRESFSTDLKIFISRVRKNTDLPLCVGFGISNAQQAGQVASLADGVIIGSRIIQLMDEGAGDYKKLRDFIAGIRAAIDAKSD